jgi:hypothetical protein
LNEDRRCGVAWFFRLSSCLSTETVTANVDHHRIEAAGGHSWCYDLIGESIAPRVTALIASSIAPFSDPGRAIDIVPTLLTLFVTETRESGGL